MTKKELIIVFEEEQEIQVNLEQSQIQYDMDQQPVDYDLANYLKVVTNGSITNEDGTLILTVKNGNTNIDTNVIQRYGTYYEFPNRGKENVIYIALENHTIYCWDNGRYHTLSGYTDIKIINGGDANGRENS